MPIDDPLKDLKLKVEADNKAQSREQAIRQAMQPIATSLTPISDKTVTLTEGTTAPSEVFERLNSGKYVAKFDGYYKPTGNEDIFARKQSGWEQAYMGLAKFGGKTLAYATDMTIGNIYGIASAIKEGSLQAWVQNDFSKSIDDINKQMDYKLPNYYSDEQKSMSLLRQLGTVNFWANDALGGLAFVTGAVLPSFLMAPITGGTSFATLGARAGFKLGTGALAEGVAATARGGIKAGLSATNAGRVVGSKILKEGLTDGVKNQMLREAIEYGVTSQQGRQIIRGLTWSKYGQGIGNFVDTAKFLTASAGYEAGMEARHNFRQSMDSFAMDFYDKNGRLPETEEIQKFAKQAMDASNGVFLANMVILSISNASMFGKSFFPKNTFAKTDNFFNKAIGLGISPDKTGKLVLQQANRTQRILGNTYKILGKATMEGGFEEGLQGVAGTSMQKYLETKYDPTKQEADSMFAFLGDALAEQYTTKEGLKEVLIGGLIGIFGGAVQFQKVGDKRVWGGIEGFGKNSYSAARKSAEEYVKKSNEALVSLGELANDRKTFTRMMSDASYAKRAAGSPSVPSLSMLDTALHYMTTNEHLYSTKEMVNNYQKMMENTQLTKEQIDELAKNGLTEEEFKAQQIKTFTTYANNFNLAKKAADALEIPATAFSSNGEALDFRDAYIRNIMLGKDAMEMANQRLEAIAKETGVSQDVVNTYEQLNEKQKALVSEQQEKIEEREKLLQMFQPLDAQRAALQDKTDPADIAKKNDLAEQRVQLQETLARLEAEIAQNKAVLQSSVEAAKTKSQELFGQNLMSVEQMIEGLGKLDGYVKAKELNGQIQEAEDIRRSLYEFKMYTDMHREFVNAQRKMSDANYFQSSEGRSLLQKLAGPRYKMSKDVREALDQLDSIADFEVNEVIEQYLGRPRTTESVSQLVEEMLEKNTQLSEREKFRLESMVRIIMSKYTPYTPADFQEAIDQNETEDNEDGDSAASSERPTTVQPKTPLQIAEEELDKLLSKLEQTLNQPSPQKQQQIKDIQEKIKTLEAELERIKSERATTQTKPQPATTTEATRTAIDIKVAELKARLQEVRENQAQEQDLEAFLNSFIEEATQSVGEDIDALNEKISQLKELYEQRKTKPAKQKVQDKIEQAKQEVSETTTFANELVTRLKETQRRKAQLQEAERDLQAQIAVYENLKETNQDNVEAINQKIERLQQKRNTLTSLLDKVSNAIQRAFSTLSDLVASVFRKQNNIESFTAFTGFRRKTQEELQEAIRKGELENDYGQLNTNLQELEEDLISALDAVENQEGLVSILENERNNLDEAITKVDNHIRYLQELKTEIEDATKNNQQLTDRENAIFTDKTAEVNDILVQQQTQTKNNGIPQLEQKLADLKTQLEQKKAELEQQQPAEIFNPKRVAEENLSLGQAILQRLGFKKENRLPNGNVRGGQAGWKIRFNIKNPTTGESYYDDGKSTLVDEEYKKRAEILINFLLDYFGSNQKADPNNLEKHYILTEPDGTRREPFKHLKGGEIGESDFTIYIGSADDVLKFISDIRIKHPEILELLHAGNKSSDVMVDDIFKGRIEGRKIGFSGYHVPEDLNKVTGEDDFIFFHNGKRVVIGYYKDNYGNYNAIDINIYSEETGKGYTLFDKNMQRDLPELYANIRNIVGFQLYGDYLTGSNDEFIKLTGVENTKEIFQNQQYKTQPQKPKTPTLSTVKVDLSNLSIEELKNVVKQLKQKEVDAKANAKTGKKVVVTEAQYKADRLALKSYIEVLESQPQIQDNTQLNNEISSLEQQIAETQKQIGNATKNNQQQEQKSPEQSGVSQYTPTDEGQQNQEEATQSETNTSDSTLESEQIQSEIDQLKSELNSLTKKTIIMETPDYKRMEELMAVADRTVEQEEELQELKTKMDNWMIVTGTVVEGIRLSDLVEQKVALENLKVQKLEEVQDIPTQEIVDIAEGSENKSRIYYENGQTHDKVTIAYKQDKGVVISGLREEDIEKVFNQRDSEGNDVPIEFEYEIDPQNGNIIIQIEELDKLNTQESNIMVRPSNSNVPQTYSILYQRVTKMGKEVWEPVSSTYTDYVTPHSPQEAYNVKPGQELSAVIDTRDEFNKQVIDKYNKSSKTPEDLEELIANLRINTYAGKNNVGDLKAITESDKLSEIDIAFIALRQRIVTDNLDLILEGGDKVVTAKDRLLVNKVYPGHPTLLVERGADGAFYFGNRRVSKSQAETIEDIGVKQIDGKLQTRSGKTEETLDTTYLPKSNKKPLPFVVIRVGEKRIAYPVRMVERQRPDLNEFRKIFDANTLPHYKAMRLNEYMASVGINIREADNAFIALGKADNLTEEKFESMVAKIENLDYFYPLKEWLDQKIPMAQIIEERAVVNFDLNNPFHSPKIAFTYPKVGATAKATQTAKKQTAKATNQKAGAAANALSKLIEKTLEENCITH